MKFYRNGIYSINKLIIVAVIPAIILLVSCQAEQVMTPTEPSEHRDLHLTFFSSEDFTGSGECAVCHTNLVDAANNDVSIDSHWRSTMMANASKDPFWQAKVASEVARTPQLKEVIEDKCASCHMPMAYTQANVDSLPTLVLGDGFLNPKNNLNELAMDGNSCTLCHQIIDPVLGKYHIDTSTDPPDRLIYGPYDDVSQTRMMLATDFRPVFGEQVSQSVLCGTCH